MKFKFVFSLHDDQGRAVMTPSQVWIDVANEDIQRPPYEAPNFVVREGSATAVSIEDIKKTREMMAADNRINEDMANLGNKVGRVVKAAMREYALLGRVNMKPEDL